MLPILLALGSNISFATASLFFTDFAKKISPTWVNYFKATLAFLCFLICMLIFQVPTQLPFELFVLLVLSGVVGLMIGDIFLLKSFTELGSGRVLMIFGFQPLILGAASYFLFNEHFSLTRLIAILFLIGCLLCFSIESFKEKGHWGIKGITFALVGILLDATGLLLTKSVFNSMPDISIFLVNVIRSGSTVLGFFLVSLVPMFGLKLLPAFRNLNKKDKITISLASILGTFLSLTFYLKAVQIGHLATISAIVGTSPLFATVFEIARGRKKLTPHLGFAVIFFISGVSILLFA
jgi:drug/metabolite transporter (DMT)-like permease